MTPEQLQEFDAACRKSTKAGNEWLDTFLKGVPYGGVAAKRSAKRMYMVPRVGADIARVEIEDTLSELLQLINIGPVVRKMRKAHEETQMPGPTRVPSARWVALIESSGKALKEPDQEALVCLRLLESQVASRYLKDYAWVTPLVSRRLAEILAEYPVLMHPRLVWDASHSTFGQQKGVAGSSSFSGEPAPMAQALHTTTRCVEGWPSNRLGIAEKAIVQFDQHPVVELALKAKAPHLVESFPTKRPQVYGHTLGMLLHERTPRAPHVGATLLRLARNAAAGKKPGAASITSSAEWLGEGIRSCLHAGFTTSFVDDDVPGREELLRELSLTATSGRTNLQRFVLESASRVFYDQGTVSLHRSRLAQGQKIRIGERNPAPDVTARLDRALDGLVAANLASNANEAAQAVFKALFPLSDEGYSYSAAMDTVEVQVALSFLQRVESMGVTHEEMARRILNPEFTCSNWAEAQRILTAERTMRAIVNGEAEVQTRAQEPVAPEQRRRMRGGL